MSRMKWHLENLQERKKKLMAMDSIRKIDECPRSLFFPMRMIDFITKQEKLPDPPPDDPSLKGWSLGPMKQFKQYKVCLRVDNRSFECLLTLSIKFNVPPPSEGKLVELSRIAFLGGIKQHISSGGSICLPMSVTETNMSMDDAAYALITKQMNNTVRSKNYDNVKVDTPAEPTYKCEADKPIGTRDVEKFLQEQQAKLWNGGS